MSSVAFTPESLFRVSTLGVPAREASWTDPGAHLRAWVAPAVGFPLHPFTLWPVRRELLADRPGSLVDVDVIWWVWRDGAREQVDRGGQVDVGRFGTVYGDLVGATGPFAESRHAPWFCWVRLRVDGSSAMRLDVVGGSSAGSERTLVSRSQNPYALGASRITRIRLTGDGIVTAVFGLDAARFSLDSVDLDRPVQLGLPLDGDNDNDWYTGAQGFDSGLHRAADAAPPQAGPPDRPDGPTALSRDDEMSRLQALTSDIGETAAHNLLTSAYADPGILPARHRTGILVDGPRNQGHLEFGSIETLLAGAADPGLARWLGLAGVDPSVDLREDPVEPLAWVAAGLWAVDPGEVVASPPPVTVQQVMDAARIGGLDVQALEHWTRPLYRLYPELERMAAHAGRRGLEILALAAPAGLGALPELPNAPELTLDGPGADRAGQWENLDRFTQRIRLRGPTPAGPVAFAQTVQGKSTSLHETVDTEGPTMHKRALTLLPGRADGPAGGEAVLTSLGVPGTAGQVTWRVAVADEFGRWGPQATLPGDPPPRPPLPNPTVEVYFTPDLMDRDLPDGPRSPGAITVQVPVPPAEHLTPGTLPVRTVRITVDVQPVGGHPDGIDVAQMPSTPAEARLIALEVPARATRVAERVPVPVVVEFADGRGGSSRMDVVVSVTDPRRPPPITTAPALLWASRRDPTGHAELALTWPPQPGHGAYRVYVGDERALAAALELTPGIPENMSRAERAERIFERSDQLTDRKWFTLATDPPMPPRADGQVVFTHRVPGSLRTIQFVRIVPLTAHDVEAPFARCGLVPVAVPGDDRPPAPGLTVRPDGSLLRVEITAGGLNPDLLGRHQPTGQANPEFRLRRTTGLTADPLYLRVVKCGVLHAVPGQPGRFTATELIDPADGALPAFVRHTWVAEVRYPAEIAVRPQADPVVTPVRADWAAANPGTPQPSGWSAPSAPVSSLLTDPVPPVMATAARAADGSVALSVREAPAAHPDAIGPWRLRVWRRTADGGVRPLAPDDPDVAATPDPGTPAGPADGWALTVPDLGLRDHATGTAGFAVALVDPLGHPGPLTEVAPA